MSDSYFLCALLQILKQMQQLRCHILRICAIGIKEDLLRLIPKRNVRFLAVLFKHILTSSFSKRIERTYKNNVAWL